MLFRWTSALTWPKVGNKYTDPATVNASIAKDIIVGVEIKVIGNDGGEKLSILSGFISRVDRNAPNYSGYRDFNTSYYQANAAASGGSSGSPVVNIDGYAVALQAGGRTDKASTDYFLPLYTPLRALQHIKKGIPVFRGGIQASFLLKPFDECRRLGLTPEIEEVIRDTFSGENNMLVAETILPEGPSDEKIKEGDILVNIGGKPVVRFQDLEEILDGSIGQTLKFTLRRGDTDVEVDIGIEDLERITPSRFVAVSGAIFHDLSYQVANRYAIACKGVYICESGLLDMPKRNGWIVESIDFEDTPNLDRFIEVVKDLPDRARVGVKFRDLCNLHTLNTGVMTLNRHWPASMKLGTRNDKTGFWDFEVLSQGLPAVPLEPSKASFSHHAVQPAVADILRSFVQIESMMPLLVDGVGVRNRTGMGLVIDAERGLVIVSREVVPHRMCTIEVTVADSILIDGEVIFLHPTQNYCIVRYDPNLVDAPVQTAVLDTEQVLQGAQTMFVGFATMSRMVCAATSVTQIMPAEIEPLNPPMYRPMNMDWIGVDTSLGAECDSGVLLSTTNGKVQAFWMSFEMETGTDRFGVPSTTLNTVLSRIREGTLPDLRVLPAEFRRLTVFEARVLGVSDQWIDKIHEKESYHQLFVVKRAVGDDAAQLMEGDVLLTVNGNLITNATELDVTYFHETLDAVVVRDGEEMTLKLETIPDDDIETSHLVVMCGLVLHKPHRAVRQQMKRLPSEVYIGSRKHGSPADVYCRLYPTKFITHLNDTPTPTLESVLEVARKIPDNTCKNYRTELIRWREKY